MTTTSDKIESFTQTMRHECSAIWDAQLTRPFVVALADGTLPQETFQFSCRTHAS